MSARRAPSHGVILRTILAAVLPAASLVAGTAAAAGQAAVSWKTVQAGVEFASITAQPGLAAGSSPLYVVRVDPGRATIGAGLASQGQHAPQTAGAWCRTSRFAVATNLGMFDADQRSHTGYLREERHVNSRRWNDYRSVLAVRPKASSLAQALWLDLDPAKPPPVLDSYGIVVQNLRLIAGNRKNVWSQSTRRWSEAALAIDSRGRLLFLFSRAPYSMRDFNDLLLKLPLDVQRAMHLEGGPEASLSVHVPGLDLDLCGSYETGFLPSDSNDHQWPIPNVLGVLRQDAKPSSSPP